MKITKRFSWAMGHRLTFHKGRCYNRHGHNFEMKVSVEGRVSKNGMVMDFGELKEIFNNVVDEPLDHSFMYYEKDILLPGVLEQQKLLERPEKIVIVKFETTAENISKYLFEKFNHEVIKKTLGRCKVNRVKVYETNSSEAAYYG